MSSFNSPARPSRKSSFKAGVNSPAARTKRAEQACGIRKNKREEGLRKRRQLALQGSTAAAAAAAVPATAGESTVTLATLAGIVPTLAAASVERQIEVTRAVRKLLSKQVDPPVEPVITAGFLPALVAFLGRTDAPKLQFEAAWALTNIASTEETARVAHCGAVPALVPLLRSPDPDVREQAAWCLGNVAGDGEVLRDVVLSSPDALQGLLLNLTHAESTKSMRRNVVWTVSNLCRGKDPASDLRLVAPAVPVLVSLIAHDTDFDTTTDACWALAYLSDGENENIEAVVSQGATPALVNLLAKYAEDPAGAKVVTPSLRTLGNIVTGTDEQTQAAMDAGLLKQLARLLENVPKKGIKKEACWAASNITAGTKEQVGAFLTAPNLAEQVMHQLRGADWDIRKEAAYCITNVCTGGQKEHVQCLVERHGVVTSLCELLKVHDVPMVLQALEALKNVLEADPGQYPSLVEEAGGMDLLEELQEHDSEKVYKKAVVLIERFFGGDDDEDENLLPNTTEDGGAFTFAKGVPVVAEPSFDFGAFN